MRAIQTAGLCLVLLVFATAAQADGITPTQLLDIEQVRSCDLSPDGKLAAYTVFQNRQPDQEAGGGWSRLYVVGTEGGQPRPFITGEVTVGAPRFSPDGRFVAFTMTRGEKAKAQVWAIAVDGGEARAVTDSPTGVKSWSWSHDGAHVFYVDTEPASDREKALKEKGHLPRIVEENLKDRLLQKVAFVRGAEPAVAETLVAGLAVWGLSVGEKGEALLFGASADNLVDQQYMFQDVRRLDLKTGKHDLVVDAPGKLGTYRLSPDGGNVAWTGAASRSDHSTSSLFVTAVGSAENRNLTPAGFAGHIRSVAWLDSETLLYQADEGVTTTISIVKLNGDPADRNVVFDGGREGLVVGMPVVRPEAGLMLTVGHNGTTPRELYAVYEGRKPLRLTHHNEWLADVKLGEQRVVRWTARDGLELEGILMLPVGGKTPAPLVMDVHGGPESNERDGWLSRYASPGQALCAKGFAVFFPNYRGSTGRGVEFAALAFGDPAGPEFDDIVDAVDHLIAEGIADKDRIGVMGGSYGGYATNWLCTYHTERFQAGVSFVGVSDLISKRFLTNIPFEDEYVHMGRPVRGSWDLMLERSPVRYAEQSRTPLLILHGDSDPRVHPSQSQELHRALKMAGHPSVRLIMYPGEGHGNRKRFGREDALKRTMRWFEYYLAEGRDWDGEMPEVLEIVE